MAAVHAAASFHRRQLWRENQLGVRLRDGRRVRCVEGTGDVVKSVPLWKCVSSHHHQGAQTTVFPLDSRFIYEMYESSLL